MSLVNSPLWALLLQAILYCPGTFCFACVLPFWAMGCCWSPSSPCSDCFTVLFCPLQLPTGLYKKVLVILHDSILPYMNEPTLMIDFLTVAYGIGEWKQAFLFFLRLCSMVHMDSEGLLDATPRPGWWNRCTFGWIEAKELTWTSLSLKMRCFNCVCQCCCSLYVRKITFKSLGRVEYWSDFF